MKDFLNAGIAGRLHTKGRRQALIDALYTKGQLKLDYDTTMTRNASQAFAARSGNCLSLVIMTAAFAKELGLPVRYQQAFVDETWSRAGDVYFSVGHVNLTLGSTRIDPGSGVNPTDVMMIDFLPPGDIRGLRTRIIEEKTIVAMYMNNRAVESLADGQLDDAYWWARAAIAQDPRFLSAVNTLGGVYRSHGNPEEARQAFTYVLEREPANTNAMANLVPVLNDLGRVAESKDLSSRLAQIEPHPPFSFFNRGLAAMEDGNFRVARDWFRKEVERAAYYHEFHFWLAVAHIRLGEFEQARKHLNIAMETSTTRDGHDMYAAKLDRIRPNKLH
jgi:tetratricopeptide (TPR) repeat protein